MLGVNKTRMEILYQEKLAMKQTIDKECPSGNVDYPLGKLLRNLTVEHPNASEEVDNAIMLLTGKKKCTKTLRSEYTKLGASITNFLSFLGYLEFEIRLTKSISLRELEKNLSTTPDNILFETIVGLIPLSERDDECSIHCVLEKYIKSLLRGPHQAQAIKFLNFIVTDLMHPNKWKDQQIQAESVPCNVPFSKCSEEEISAFVEAHTEHFIHGNKYRTSVAAKIYQSLWLSQLTSESLVSSEDGVLFRLGLLLVPPNLHKESSKKISIPLNELSQEVLFKQRRYQKQQIKDVAESVLNEAKNSLQAFDRDFLFARPNSEMRDLLGTLTSITNRHVELLSLEDDVSSSSCSNSTTSDS